MWLTSSLYLMTGKKIAEVIWFWNLNKRWVEKSGYGTFPTIIESKDFELLSVSSFNLWVFREDIDIDIDSDVTHPFDFDKFNKVTTYKLWRKEHPRMWIYQVYIIHWTFSTSMTRYRDKAIMTCQKFTVFSGNNDFLIFSEVWHKSVRISLRILGLEKRYL